MVHETPGVMRDDPSLIGEVGLYLHADRLYPLAVLIVSSNSPLSRLWLADLCQLTEHEVRGDPAHHFQDVAYTKSL